jgi:hypothetical protein
MRSLSERLILGLICCIVVVASAPPVLAAGTSNSEFVIIPEGDVFPEDLYAGAIRVVVEGTIDGDLIAFAAEEILINGTVTGSVLAVAPLVTVNGEVHGSLRVTGNRLDVDGTVGGDVVAAVRTAGLSASSLVTGDVLAWAWSLEALGSIGADLTGSQRRLELAGTIGGDVDVSVASLTIVAPLVVRGDLGYRSDREVEGLEHADIGGTVVAKTSLPPNLRIRALGLLGRLMVVLFLAVAALASAYGWPARTARAVSGVGERPLRKWLAGALVLFAPLGVVLLAGAIVGLAPAAAAFPLLAVLIPVVLALIGVAFALSLIAGAPVVGWVGGVVFKRLGLYGSILAGSLLAGLLWYLPVAGWLVPVVALPLGLGSWIATWRQAASESYESPDSSSASAIA